MQKKPTFFQKFSAVFAEDSGFMRPVGTLLTLAVLNLCCLLCLLTLLLGGGALTALYRLLPEVPHLSFDAAFRRFFRQVRVSWKRTLLPFLLSVIAVGGLLSAWRTVLTLGLTNHFFVLLPLLLVSAGAGFCLLWLFPVLARGEEDWLTALRTAFLLGLKELPRSLLLLLPEAGLLLLAMWCSGSLSRLGLWLFFGIAPLAWVKARILSGALSGPESK